MLVKENEYLQEAAESLYVANADEIVRQQCIAREDAERRERTLEKVAREHRIAREDAERRERTLEKVAEEHRIAREAAEQREAELTKEVERLKNLLEKVKSE